MRKEPAAGVDARASQSARAASPDDALHPGSGQTPVELTELEVPKELRPRHVAIIMDGNGRWAGERNLPRIEGHRHGVASVRRTVEESARLGIKQLTLFCLSSENWKRPRDELSFLMHLLEQYMIEERSVLLREGIRISIIGRRDGIPESVEQEIDKTVDMCRGNEGMELCLAVNYGARVELLDAVRRIAEEVDRGRLDPASLSEETISEHLYTAHMPDPDLVIRTAGEMRVSNFLLWQISYSEFWVTPRCWPDFREADLHQAIREFAARDRRFGGL